MAMGKTSPLNDPEFMAGENVDLFNEGVGKSDPRQSLAGEFLAKSRLTLRFGLLRIKVSIDATTVAACSFSNAFLFTRHRG